MAEIKIENVDKKMVAEKVNSNELIYFNPLKNKKFVIEGLPFINDHKQYFRLPLDQKDNVTEAVWWLSSQPSGGQIRFKTNAKKISVKIKNKGDYLMCHMPCTGQQGVDLYYKRKVDKQYTFFTCAKFAAPSIEYESVVFDADEKEDKDIIINLPLYEGLEEILIGVEQNAYIKKAKPHKRKGKVVIYGTSITQGGCASRPGMSFTNILSRKLDVEFVDFGFSGSGLGEVQLAHIINKIDDKNMVILDYEANGGATGDMEHNLEDFIDTIRNENKDIPIVVISKVFNTTTVFNKKEQDKRAFYLSFQKDMVEKKKANGDNNIYFVDGNLLIGDKVKYEAFVDGLHPTDLGFYEMAKSLYPIISKLLKK